MKYSLNNNNKGVTLIELLISIAILGIVIIGLLPMFTGSVINIYNFGEKYQYFSEVQGVLEEELAKEYEDIISSEIDIDDKIKIKVGVIETSLSINVSHFEDNVLVHGKEVKVTAVYKDNGRILISLSSFITDSNFIYDIEN